MFMFSNESCEDGIESVESQVKRWGDEIEHLDARADIILGQLEDSYYGLVRSLRSKEVAIQQQLERLRATGEDDSSRERMVVLLAQAARDLKTAIYRAAEEIENTHYTYKRIG